MNEKPKLTEIKESQFVSEKHINAAGIHGSLEGGGGRLG